MFGINLQYFFTVLRRGWRILPGIACAAGIFSYAAGATDEAAALDHEAAVAGKETLSAARPPGQIVDIGSHRLHLNCRGAGAPTVILEAGLGGFSLEWLDLQARLQAMTRVCAYDRAGYGWSDPGPLPRTAEQIVGELAELLERAEIEGPLVMVGHSFGGYIAQLLAKQQPELVAGVVLLDSSHPMQHQRLPHPAGKTVGELGARSRLVSWAVPPPGYPERARTLAFHLMQQPWAVRAQRAELLDFETSAAQVAAAGALPHVPAIVVTRGARVWPRTAQGNAFESTWAELQRELAHAFGNAPQRIVPGAGHYVHLDAPAAVAQAIERVIGAVRCRRDMAVAQPCA